ncbi:UNVERIFIED_CONTAM: hypothetical protein RMT77_002727 [Armadillidium vulgare]|uniref:Vesicle-associated membrane protein-associated protein A n=1 Tax=Armadillidium nasatum TaxID=96803 RepID=A0A5N5SRT3_9CRUS|nr:Vesicle-associated membrane protein-associated protein A [Armadillidium nasatum]
MSRPEQVLILEPSNELRFCGPFNDVVTSKLKLTNPTSRKVCFKVKTTAPRKYCVRPNSGVVEPNKYVEVAVMLQPFEYDPNEKNKHKFMVQTIFAPDGEFNLESLFKDSDQNKLMDSKLRCVFELPTDAQDQQAVESVNVPQEQKEGPKASPKPVNLENELRKASEEIKKLREETSSLRQENFQLKEDALRVRNVSSTMGERPTIILPPNQMQQAMPVTQYVMIVVVALLAFVVGKFIL